MKKLLLAIFLLFAPSIAFAQCNGVFQPNFACGKINAAGPPGPIPFSVIEGGGGSPPGGASGSTQFNNSGVFGGYVPSGDCTVNTTTGVTTCTKTNGTAFGPLATSPSGNIANGHVIANASGGSGPPADTAPSTWFDQAYCNTVGYIIVRLSGAWTCNNNFPRNIVWFGADPTGSAASNAAYNAAWATLSSVGGVIYFPTGRYMISANATNTLPNAPFSIMLKGDGPTATTVFWPNASGGFQLIATSPDNNFHIRDMSLVTSQTNSGCAICLQGFGDNAGNQTHSDITDVIIKGNDLGPSSSECWAVGIWAFNWGGININGVSNFGSHGAPASAGCGVGIRIEGNVATASYTTLVNINIYNDYYHVTGMLLGDYWQGITCNACNFNGEEGTSCVQANGAAVGVLVLITFTNSQFNCGGSQIIFASPVISPTFIGNTITLFGNNNLGFSCQEVGCSGLILQGNIINQAGSATGQTGVVWDGTGGVVSGNWFNNITNGVNLQSGSADTNVQANSYGGSVTTQVTNNGTNNAVGVATK